MKKKQLIITIWIRKKTYGHHYDKIIGAYFDNDYGVAFSKKRYYYRYEDKLV